MPLNYSLSSRFPTDRYVAPFGICGPTVALGMDSYRSKKATAGTSASPPRCRISSTERSSTGLARSRGAHVLPSVYRFLEVQILRGQILRLGESLLPPGKFSWAAAQRTPRSQGAILTLATSCWRVFTQQSEPNLGSLHLSPMSTDPKGRSTGPGRHASQQRPPRRS